MSKNQDPQPTLLEVAQAICQSQAWDQKWDVPFEWLKPRKIADFFPVSEDILRKAVGSGQFQDHRLGAQHPDLEIGIYSFVEWFESTGMPCAISPAVVAWTRAVQAHAELLRRTTGEINDSHAQIIQLVRVVYAQRDDRDHARRLEKIEADRQAEESRQKAEVPRLPPWQQRAIARREAEAVTAK